LETAPQTFKLRMVDASTDANGVNEPAIRIVVAEQKRPQPGTRPSGSVQPITTNSSRFRAVPWLFTA
jgi:hypothetical protein